MTPEDEIELLRTRLEAIARVTIDEGIWKIARGLDDRAAAEIAKDVPCLTLR